VHPPRSQIQDPKRKKIAHKKHHHPRIDAHLQHALRITPAQGQKSIQKDRIKRITDQLLNNSDDSKFVLAKELTDKERAALMKIAIATKNTRRNQSLYQPHRKQ